MNRPMMVTVLVTVLVYPCSPVGFGVGIPAHLTCSEPLSRRGSRRIAARTPYTSLMWCRDRRLVCLPALSFPRPLLVLQILSLNPTPSPLPCPSIPPSPRDARKRETKRGRARVGEGLTIFNGPENALHERR